VIAVAGPLAISVVFGKAFDGAIAMVFLLLLSSLPASVSGIIATLLGAAGQPGQVLRAQAVGLAVSVPLLAIAIPHFGGLGAAAVDNITNLTVAAVVLRYAIGTFGGRATDYTVPRSSDVRKLWSSLLGMLRRLSTA
jgi:O-antigen/teichoic acid export membrane protein